MTDGGPVREHYASEGITERVLTALRNANGPDVPITPETLAPIDHFHGKGVIATEELVAELQPKASDNLLDITIFIHQLGSGLISNPGNAWEIV